MTANSEIKTLVSVIADVLRNSVTPETLANAADLVALGYSDDFILVLAGANPDNLADVRSLAIEELEMMR